jgi:hypothetical protein
MWVSFLLKILETALCFAQVRVSFLQLNTLHSGEIWQYGEGRLGVSNIPVTET